LQVFTSSQLHSMFCVLYQLCRVSGMKKVARLMPHEVGDLEPVIHALEAQDTEDHSTWETRYGLLIWLNLLSLVPFDLSSIDSSLAWPEDSKGWDNRGGGAVGVRGQAWGLVEKILELGRKHLGDPGPTRDVAAPALGSLLTRPDLHADHLERFLEWSAQVLEVASAEGRDGDAAVTRTTFLAMGIMQTLAQIFKRGHREKLVRAIPIVFGSVVRLGEQATNSQSLFRKMVIKVLQRIGATFLKPRVVKWRYQRGQRSLLQNLSSQSDGRHPQGPEKDPPVSSPAAGTPPGDEDCGAGGRGEGEEEEDAEEDVDMPEELEEIIEALLCGLRDWDTVVRWSAAKGVGRITERLPKDLADDVVCSVLDLFIGSEGDAAWQGGCLALAELSRQDILRYI
ncbi:unnamed protein product, partial [Discosporangium mesarthrocarpum]